MSNEFDQLLENKNLTESSENVLTHHSEDSNGFVLKVKGHVIKSVEELPICPIIREVVNSSYEISRRATFVKDSILVEDVRRTSIKMPGSLVSGFDMGAKLVLVDHLIKVKGYCGELKAYYTLALDQRYIDDEMYIDMLEKCKKITLFADKMILCLKGNKIKQMMTKKLG
ncbi:MAG: four helix bundle protein [Pseudomonadota bacterium]